MADSNAITEIGKYTDKYILKRKLQQEDYFIYLQHACDCFRTINTRHSNEVVTAKVSVSALGIIDWPSDMVNFGFIAVPIGGLMWTFSRKGRKVATTTTTDGVVGQDSDMGEGVDIKDNVYWGIGGRGGVNSYYVTVNERERKITCDGFKSDTAILQYTSSGLVVNGTTYIPIKCERVLDTYIDWQREISAPRSIAMMQNLRGYYDDELQGLRLVNFMPSLDEIADIWDEGSTIGVQR